MVGVAPFFFQMERGWVLVLDLLQLRYAMKDTEIRLNADDLKCLNRGGSIEYEIKDGREVRAVVCLSIESDVKGFRWPTNHQHAASDA